MVKLVLLVILALLSGRNIIVENFSVPEKIFVPVQEEPAEAAPAPTEPAAEPTAAESAENNSIKPLLDCIYVKLLGKSYKELAKRFGTLKDVYVKEEGIEVVFENSDVLFIVDLGGPTDWYSKYYEAGHVPLDVALAELDDSIYAGAFFALRDIGIEERFMPESSIVGNLAPSFGQKLYSFETDTAYFHLSCYNNGEVDGNCGVSLYMKKS